MPDPLDAGCPPSYAPTALWDARGAGGAEGAGLETLSVVVPAHDEEVALEGCLEALLAQAGCRLRIVVVANGCQDATSVVARSMVDLFRQRGHELHVLELETPSKPRALDAGDQLCADGPRLYLDADVRLGPGAARDVLAALQPGTGIHLAAPTLRIESPASRLTTSYTRVWSALPYVCDQVLGCGAYGVSDSGRKRWERFPALISDDRYVRLHFAEQEQRVLPTSQFTISFPESAKDLFAVRGRWCRGNRQLARAHPSLHAQDARRVIPALRFVARHPLLWPHLPAFATLFAYGRLSAYRRVTPERWERERSSVARTGSLDRDTATA